MPDECEAWLSDGTDLVAEEMEFGQGWNSPTPTKANSRKLRESKKKEFSPQKGECVRERERGGGGYGIV